MVNVIQNDNFDAVEKSAYAVVDFFATWCGPCKMLGPVMEELSEELKGKADFFKCDVDLNKSLAMKYGISSIPAVAVIKNGKLQDMSVGFRPKDDMKAFILGQK